MIKKVCLSAIAILISLITNAAVTDLPVRNVNGQDCYCYTVLPGEGELAISKKLGITVADLNKYNPSVSKGLKVNQELLFPVSKFGRKTATKEQKTATNRRVVSYAAKSGDSVYGISKLYGMTQDEFLKLNPSAANGVRAGEAYMVYGSEASPVSEATFTDNGKGGGERTHVIASQETLYSIASLYGCRVEDLLRMNPGLDLEHYEVGQRISVPVSSPDSKVAAAFSNKNRYVVKEHDTFYGIARANGLSIEQLQAANPGVNVLKEGTTIIIPDACDEASAVGGVPDVPGAETPQGDNHDGSTVQPVVENRMVVSLVLPFMREQTDKNKLAKASADFYRGFMLGVDSLKTAEFPITVLAFDTEDSAEKLSQILRDERLKKSQMIIAPDDSKSLEAIAGYGVENNINVLNLFSTKDTAFYYTPGLFQANIPYEKMVNKAVDYMVSGISDETVVILRSKGHGDKLDVVRQFTAAVKAKGIPIEQISYTDKLTEEDLSVLKTGGNYLIVPSSGKSAVASDILPVLAKFKENMTAAGRMKVLGYPEWIALKGKVLDNMKAVNTYIYSRFYANAADPETKAVEQSHLRWYGFEVPAGVPRQSLTGFDTAVFLMKTLPLNGGDFSRRSSYYDGVQNPFHFVKASDNGGWVNDCMYIINYRPSGMIEKTSL